MTGLDDLHHSVPQVECTCDSHLPTFTHLFSAIQERTAIAFTVRGQHVGSSTTGSLPPELPETQEQQEALQGLQLPGAQGRARERPQPCPVAAAPAPAPVCWPAACARSDHPRPPFLSRTDTFVKHRGRENDLRRSQELESRPYLNASFYQSSFKCLRILNNVE